MKALKIIITIILGIAMFFQVLAFGVLTSGRILLSGNNLGRIFKDIIKEEGEINMGELVSSSTSVSTDELTDVLNEISEYVSLDDVYKEMGKLGSNIIKYTAGIKDDIDTKSIMKVVKKAAKKYEEKTGERVDLDEVEESLNREIKDLKREIRQDKSGDREVMEILGHAFSNGLYFGLLIGIIICAALMYFVNKSVVPLCIHLAIVSGINGILNIIFALLVKVFAPNTDPISIVMAKNITGIFLVVALIFIVIAIASVVSGIISSQRSKKQITTA